jgi:hypothetical protein
MEITHSVKNSMRDSIVAEATTRENIVYSPIKKKKETISHRRSSDKNTGNRGELNSLFKCGKNMLAKYAESPRTAPVSSP